MKQIFCFIESQAKSFAISALCQVLRVSKSGFYGYLKARKEKPTEPLAKTVTEIFWRHRRRYGSRRIQAELKAEGERIGRHKVRRLMKAENLQAIQS